MSFRSTELSASRLCPLDDSCSIATTPLSCCYNPLSPLAGTLTMSSLSASIPLFFP